MRRPTAVAVLAGVLLLAGCSSPEADAPSPTSAPTSTGSSSASPEKSAVHYVALGDSYSAGPLIPVQRLDPLGCGRSTDNYPAYLAGWLDAASYRDVTCSGARSANIDEPQQVAVGGAVVPPQADALVAGTTLVTVGLGGNDGGLFGAIAGTCLRLMSAGAHGHAPCRRHFAGGRLGNRAVRLARAARQSVQSALAAVRRAAPAARVYVVGYPQLVPARGTCPAVPFTAGDDRWVRRVEGTLDRSIALAARATGATYVDLWTPSRGHDACAGSSAWIRGTQDVAGAAVLHPFRRGEQAMAGVVYRAITGREAPSRPGARAAPDPSAVVSNGT